MSFTTKPIINDFSLNIATVNGTGSQTANAGILRTIFNMGVPINGKNIFPSNIQSMPTWYQIRVSGAGYIARRESQDILIAFNPATVVPDMQAMNAGTVCIYNSDMRGIPERDDLFMYGLPVRKFLKELNIKGTIKDYMANMVYVGAVAQLLDLSLDIVEESLDFEFNGRRKLVDSNMAVVKMAYDWVAENHEKRDPYLLQAMRETDGKLLITGNTAAGLGSIFGGVTFVAWYPITPSTSVIDALNKYLPKLRHDSNTGKSTCAVVQAEDELAAIGMVIGAGFGGARAMTATSGPGVSLMAEFAGMAYFAEVPSVIWDIQRVGPSTGLPTRTAQCDVTFCYYLGHGDTKNVLLMPASVAECFEFGTTALNLADELQTLILVLSDLDLGMNNWMSDPFEYPAEPIKRGKVLTAAEVAEKGFHRYKDIDGDGIGYRTWPGNEHPLAAYFARGTGHNEAAVYSERPDDWIKNMERLERKFNTAREMVPTPVVDEKPGADFGIIAYGTTCYAIEEARDRLAADGIKTNFMRLRALPINDSVKEFVSRHDKVFVIEMNRDGQMHGILVTEMPAFAAKLISIAHLDGWPFTAQKIIDLLGEYV